ncbi:hypothetical protein DL764_001613 [Monosporascus ibericus]|uniref:pH-response transcription factor pacC/RIM101 n=1 Tax=Monosporascus ibericus TaxID=155417 RepID=A0A4Q4TTS9_9PEZI|nr:hypothetical protein DL764_001613 [Monosporascus ibericus]
MLSNPPPSGLHARQQYQRQHRRQNSTPSAFESLKIATDLPHNMGHPQQSPQRQQQRPRMAHRRGAMSLDLRRQHMQSPSTIRQEFSTQQRIARPGPQQVFANLVSDENYMVPPNGTSEIDSLQAQGFDGLPGPQDLNMPFDMYNSQMNVIIKKNQENYSDSNNMTPSHDFEVFPSSTLSTPTFVSFQESPAGAPGWISESDTPSTRRGARRISNGIMDRVAKFESMGEVSVRPCTPPQPNPTDTPHERTIKHSQRPQRFSDDYDESAEETIKPSRNRRTKTNFDEMRRLAENRPIMPTPPRANTMPMPGAYEPSNAPSAGLLSLNGGNDISVQIQTQFDDFPAFSPSHPPSAASNSDFSQGTSPATPFMHEFGNAFDMKPDLRPSSACSDLLSGEESPSTTKDSRRGSPHRRTDSVASIASAASIASIDIEKTKTETGVTLDDIQQYIEGPDPKDNKWVCIFEDCNKRFGRKENIKSHVQTHLNDRQYQCPTCKKCFVRQHDLKRHAKIHTGIKPYPCECGNSFARHDALTRHKQRGMCIGAFDGVVRKVVKRGRPRKHRPDMDERKEKSARTRKKNKSTSSTSSQSGYSDSSAANSPEHAEPDFDMLDIMDVSIGGTTMDPTSLQGLGSSSAPMPTLSTESSTAANSPSTASIHSYVSQLSHLSLHPEAALEGLPSSQPGSPAKSVTSHCNEIPELSQSSSPPYFDLEPSSSCSEVIMMSSAGEPASIPSLGGLNDNDDDILLQFTNSASNLLMLSSDSKFDEAFENTVEMFTNNDDLFFNGN